MRICSKSVAGSFSYYYHALLWETLQSLDLKDRSILDLGCGSGEISDFVKKCHPNIKHIEGQDISPEKISQARNSFPDIKFYVRDGNDFKYKDYPHIDTIFLFGLKTPGFLFSPEFLYFFEDFLSKPQNTLYLNPVLNDVDYELGCGWIQEPTFLKTLIETSSFNYDIRLVNPRASLLEIKNIRLNDREKAYLKSIVSGEKFL